MVNGGTSGDDSHACSQDSGRYRNGSIDGCMLRNDNIDECMLRRTARVIARDCRGCTCECGRVSSFRSGAAQLQGIMLLKQATLQINKPRTICFGAIYRDSVALR
jgi:hypothetical protein